MHMFTKYKIYCFTSKYKLLVSLNKTFPPSKYPQKECPQVSMPEVIRSDKPNSSFCVIPNALVTQYYPSSLMTMGKFILGTRFKSSTLYNGTMKSHTKHEAGTTPTTKPLRGGILLNSCSRSNLFIIKSYRTIY